MVHALRGSQVVAERDNASPGAKARVFLLFGVLSLLAVGAVSAEENLGIPKLSGGRVDARVSHDPASGISSFEYRMIHAGSQLRITDFEVDISSTSDREVLSAAGLSFVNPALQATTELTLSLLDIGGFVPVGTTSDAVGWVGGVGRPAYLAWGVYKEDAEGLPGDTALRANVGETPRPGEFSVEGDRGIYDDDRDGRCV